MRLDHVSYAAGPEGLASCVQRLGARLGAGFTDGGLHPRFGTRNFVLPLDGGAYLEVVEALDHPAAETAAFGQAVKARTAEGGGWLAWVVAVTDIAAVERRLGRPSTSGHRRRPDGFDLRWKQIGVTGTAQDPQLPYFVQWETDEQHHPSSGGSQVTLTGLQIAGDEQVVDDYLGTSARQPLDGVTVNWVAPSDGATGVTGVSFWTPSGPVTVD